MKKTAMVHDDDDGLEERIQGLKEDILREIAEPLDQLLLQVDFLRRDRDAAVDEAASEREARDAAWIEAHVSERIAVYRQRAYRAERVLEMMTDSRVDPESDEVTRLAHEVLVQRETT